MWPCIKSLTINGKYLPTEHWPPALETLCLKGWKMISNGNIDSIPKTIQNLDLQNCTKLSDIGLQKLAAHCKDLKSLNLKGVYKLSPIGLTPLLKANPKSEASTLAFFFFFCSFLSVFYFPNNKQFEALEHSFVDQDGREIF
jgi:hypothetical protein